MPTPRSWLLYLTFYDHFGQGIANVWWLNQLSANFVAGVPNLWWVKSTQISQVSGPRANREALYLAPQRVSWEQSIRSFLDRSTAYEAEIWRPPRIRLG